MCIVLELARAKQENKALKARIDYLEMLIPPPAIPVTDLLMISRHDYLHQFAMKGITPVSIGTPLDTDLSITSKAELDRIAPELVYSAEYYLSQIWDCENYGLQAQSDAARFFHVSGITLGLGTMPLGYHGFALTMDKEFNIYWLVPNAGFPYAGVWYKIGEVEHYPEKVFA